MLTISSRLFLLSCFLFSCVLSAVYTQSSTARVEALIAEAKASFGEKAVPNLETAMELCEQQACNNKLWGQLYHQLSVAYFEGYIDDNLAINFVDTAIFFFEKEYDQQHPTLANEYYNRGVIRMAIGQPQEAAVDMTNALEKMLGNTVLPPSQTDSISAYWHQEIAKNYRLKRDFQLADDYANRGVAVAQKRWRGPHQIKGDLLRGLGNVRYDRNDYAGAVSYYTQARTVYENLSPRTERDLLLTDENLGLAYLGLNEHQLAIKHLQRVEQHFADLYANKPQKRILEDWANAQINLLSAEAGQGHFKKANEYFATAQTLLDSLFGQRDYWVYAELYCQQARSLLQQNELAGAQQYCQQALAILLPGGQESIGQGAVIGPFEFVLQALVTQADILKKENKPEQALEVYEQLHQIITMHRQRQLSGWSKYYLIADVVPVYEAAIHEAVQLYHDTGEKSFLEKAYAFNARNKAIILREQLQHEQAIEYAGLPMEIKEKEEELSRQLRQLNQKIYQAPKNSTTDSLRSILVTTQKMYQQFIEQIEHKYPRYYQLKYAKPASVSVKQIQQELTKDQVIVEYFSGVKELYTFVITPAEFSVFTTEQPDQLREDITLYHELLTNGIAEDCEKIYLELAYKLYQYLLAVPLSRIQDGRFQRLTIIPDGLLHFVAFETLLTKPRNVIEGSRDFLLNQYACSYHYSSYFMVHPLSTPGHKQRAKTFGGFGTEYDEATLVYLEEVFAKKGITARDASLLPCGQKMNKRYLGKLYHSDDEVKNIAQHIAGDYWLNEAVTKAAFIEQIGNYEILHLALHGSYDLDYPMNSALAFTKTNSDDALLRASEVYALDLNCNMMVLSACNTSFGKLMPGEGVMTLARAFNYAGVPAVVASLWSLPDRSTSLIMTNYYAELKKGLSKDVALRNAKLNYLNDDNLSTPSTRLPTFWGPAVVIGDTSPVFNTSYFGNHKYAYLLLGGLLILGAWFYLRKERKVS